MRYPTVLLFALGVVESGCGRPEPATQPTERAVAPPRQSKVPQDVNYTAIKNIVEGHPKTRYVDFRINRKVSKETLREIALEVMAEEPYKRIVSFYFLPEAIPGVRYDPWASTDYRPELEVEILGTTIENEAKLRRLKLSVDGKMIGSWLIDNQSGGHIDVIYEDDGPKLATFSPDGQRYVSPMTELPASKGRRFRAENSTESYDIDDAGTLRLIAADGRIFGGALPLK